MREYFELSTGANKGITPGPLPGFNPAPSKELLAINQDTAMAGVNGDEAHTRLTTSVTENTIPATTPKLSPSFAIFYNDLQSAVGNQSQSEHKWLHSRDKFKQKEACQWKVYELRVAQKKAKFEDDQAMKKAHFQINQVEQQERFQCEHLRQEIRFENEQSHPFEACMLEEKAKFQAEITQRRLQHRKQVDEESQQSFASHIQVVGRIIGKAMPPIVL